MYRNYWWALLIIALFTPLGLLAKGTAWGEWGTDEIAEMTGYVPTGMERAATLWQALFPDYAVSALGTGRFGEITGYIISAVIGGIVVYTATITVGKLAAKRSNPAVTAPRCDG